MSFFNETPLRKQIVFVAVPIIGALIWWFGAAHFVKQAPPPDDDPYQVKDIQITPVQPK